MICIWGACNGYNWATGLHSQLKLTVEALCFYVMCPLKLWSQSRWDNYRARWRVFSAVLFACVCVVTERLMCELYLSRHMCRPVAMRGRWIILHSRCADAGEKLVHFPGIIPTFPVWSFSFSRLPTIVQNSGRFLKRFPIKLTDPSVLACDHLCVCLCFYSAHIH